MPLLPRKSHNLSEQPQIPKTAFLASIMQTPQAMDSPSQPVYLNAPTELPTPILRLSKCIIRPYHESDAEPSAREANNLKISRYMRNTFPSPYLVEHGRTWIAMATSASPTRDFAICSPSNNVIIGGIGLQLREDVQYRTREVGFWLGETHWGSGIATEAVTAFAQWTFENFDNIVRLEAEVNSNNAGSARVLEKAGFVLEGRKRKAIEKHGELLDILVYGLLREDS